MDPGKRCSAGRSLKSVGQLLGVHGGDGRRRRAGPAAEPAGQLGRAREGLLDRDLLVEHHADEQGQGIAAEDGVRLGVAGQVERERVPWRRSWHGAARPGT